MLLRGRDDRCDDGLKTANLVATARNAPVALAHQIADRIHRLHYVDFTPTALEWTRAAFIDTVGVTLAGIVEDGPRILMRVPDSTGLRHSAT
jgi:2-methylcitrate dehydratase PrpD